MTYFNPGDIAVGGQHHYVEVLDKTTLLTPRLVHVLDDAGADTQQYIMGCTFRPPTGDLFTVSTPDPTIANCPHDVDWMPNDSGLLMAVVPSAGSLEFRKVGFDGTVLTTWSSIPTDTGWTNEPVKVSVACDARTVFYSMQHDHIRRFDLQTGSPLSIYATLSTTDYVFGGLRVLPGGSGDSYQVVVAMTVTGDGPLRAICLDSDRQSLWCDEINPSGSYHVQKRKLLDGTLIAQVVTEADPTPDNDVTLALACYYNPRAVRRTPFAWVAS